MVSDLLIKLASDEVGDEYAEALKLFLVKKPTWQPVETPEAVVEQAVAKAAPSFKVVARVALKATASKLTKDCFIGPRFYHRTVHVDHLFPSQSQAEIAGNITALKFGKGATYRQVAQSILGTCEDDFGMLAKGLIAGGHTIALPQIDVLTERTDNGENTGLRADGGWNCFFAANKPGEVSVIIMNRFTSQPWSVYVRNLDVVEPTLGYRFFFRNLDNVPLAE